MRKTLIHAACLLAVQSSIQIWAQEPPKLLPFQGRLTDQNGVAVANGTRFVQFKIYAVPTGGSAVWAGEVHKTTVNGGLVNVLLGSKTPFIDVDFDRTLYLEITADINGDNAITAADPPMLPRQIILPAVFAKESANTRKLAGYDWSAVFDQGATNPPSGRINGDRLLPATVGSLHIGPAAVRTVNIADAQVTREKLAPDLVRDSVIPPGTIQAFAGRTEPPGWLPCDGRPLSKAAPYDRLWSAILTQWGAGYTNIGGENVKVAGTDFNLPDLRGMFLRGVNGARGDDYRDPDFDIGSRRMQYPGGQDGNGVGSVQKNAFERHVHGYNMYDAAAGGWAGVMGSSGIGSSPLRKYVEENGSSSETRPNNAYVNYIIKY